MPTEIEVVNMGLARRFVLPVMVVGDIDRGGILAALYGTWALLDDEDDPAVFVARGGKAARVPVKLGYMDGEWAEVLSGLKQGEQVVTAGKVALREGSAVQVLGAQPAKVATKAVPKTDAKQ